MGSSALAWHLFPPSSVQIVMLISADKHSPQPLLEREKVGIWVSFLLCLGLQLLEGRFTAGGPH